MQSNKFVESQIVDLIDPTTIFSSTDPITRVIGYLKDSNEYDAVVDDGDKASIISIRELLNVENIMTQKPASIMKRVPRIGRNDTISSAAKIMFDYRLRSLPVYDGERLVGKISCSSIAKALVESNHSEESIARIATPSPICADAYDSVAKAKRLMVDKKVDQLPVLKEKRLVGILTSESIAFRILPPTDRGAKGAPQVGRLDMDVISMSDSQVVTNEVTDSVGKTLENMLRTHSNYSVVTNGDEVQGIVTYRDFLKLLPTAKSSEIPVSILGLPDDPLQSEIAKKKFQNSVKLLSKAAPGITQARAVVKSGQSKAPKKRYQVQVLIESLDSRHSYETTNYDLAKAFQDIEAWIKKLASNRGGRKQKGKKRETTRKLTQR